MSDQLRSIVYGTSLMILTAIGCISYEKIVKSYSYSTVIILYLVYAIPMLIVFCFLDKTTFSQLVEIYNNKNHLLHASIYVVTWSTSILWYLITKKQGVMVGSIYEIKYVVILAIFYVIAGENKFTLNTLIGLVLAIASVYFISSKK